MRLRLIHTRTEIGQISLPSIVEIQLHMTAVAIRKSIIMEYHLVGTEEDNLKKQHLKIEIKYPINIMKMALELTRIRQKQHPYTNGMILNCLGKLLHISRLVRSMTSGICMMQMTA